MLFTLSLLVVALGSVNAPASGQFSTSEPQKIWACEEACWSSDAAKDLTWIDACVHPDATSWGFNGPDSITIVGDDPSR